MMAQSDETLLMQQIARLVDTPGDGRGVRIESMPAGLGTRRFFRVRQPSGHPPSVIARVEIPEKPPAAQAVGPEPALEPIRARLEAEGLPVPKRIGGDPALGIDLLEDVGDQSLQSMADQWAPSARNDLYQAAAQLIPRLQRITPLDGSPVAAFTRQFDEALLDTKARKWLEWTLPRAWGRAASEQEVAATRSAFALIQAATQSAPRRLAHRDFKAANIHVIPDDGEAPNFRLVLIDLQGAFMAPPEYDLVCLLRDSQVRLPESEVQSHLAATRPQLPDAPEADEFLRRFDLLSVARLAKDISHFVQAAAGRGDSRYVRFVPNGLHQLRQAAHRAAERDAEMAAFAALCQDVPDHFAESLPQESEENPPCAP